jgi:hypothetical protein
MMEWITKDEAWTSMNHISGDLVIWSWPPQYHLTPSSKNGQTATAEDAGLSFKIAGPVRNWAPGLKYRKVRTCIHNIRSAECWCSSMFQYIIPVYSSMFQCSGLRQRLDSYSSPPQVVAPWAWPIVELLQLLRSSHPCRPTWRVNVPSTGGTGDFQPLRILTIQYNSSVYLYWLYLTILTDMLY